ncbi:MAG: PIG-L deacetylase family protein [Anaerolineales bacterium]|jgi:LmbE family N-acetylglucosaminyl deacetylase
MSDFYVPESALAVFAHPDDIEFSCAGTMARWAKAGCRIRYVVCTSGQVGIRNAETSPEQAKQIRESEQRRAAEIAGAQDVVFLGETDGILIADLALRKKIVAEIRRFRPEVVVCPDPTVVFANENYINHPDHRAAGLATLEAVFPAAGQPNVFEELAEEGLQAHKTRKVYVTSFSQGDTFVNITDTIDTKVKALMAHESQMKEMKELGSWDAAERIREWAAENGKGKEMDFAEVYKVITLENDEWWSEHKGKLNG